MPTKKFLDANGITRIKKDQLDTLETVVNIIDNAKVDKSVIGNTGITNSTYTTVYGGEFTVTTAETTGYKSPKATITKTQRPTYYQFRVTFTNTTTNESQQYVLDGKTWHSTRLYSYLGNLNLYIDVDASIPYKTDNCPFVIVETDDEGTLDILTSEAGTYKFLVEQINNTEIELPKSLIYGYVDTPLQIARDGETSKYFGYSIGVANKLESRVATVAIGENNTVSEDNAIAIGLNNVASEYGAIATGELTTAEGENSFTSGYQTTASGSASHAEGMLTVSSHVGSHAEGNYSKASNSSSHAEGEHTTASGPSAHAEGIYTTASGYYAHAEGGQSQATGLGSHAENILTVASGRFSHSQGYGTEAAKRSQFVFGEYNIIETNSATTDANNRGTYVEIVGNGEQDSQDNTIINRSNARTLDWSGNEVLAGKLTVGAGPTQNMDVATKIYVDTQVGNAGSSGVTTQTVTGTDPVITAQEDYRYICGTVLTLSFTPSATGICNVFFTSGSTPTVLTLPNTVKMPEWFEIETNRIYEISILNGVYGAVMSWAV